MIKNAPESLYWREWCSFLIKRVTTQINEKNMINKIGKNEELDIKKMIK